MSLTFELAGGEDDGFEPLRLGGRSAEKRCEVQTEKRPARWWQWLRGLQGPRRRWDLPQLNHRLEYHAGKLKPLNALVYPQGPGSCDHNSVDRAVNLVTTLPFFPIAWHTYRERKTPEGRLFGASIAGVGLGSLAFHCTSGEWRPLARKADYVAIALSSLALVRSVLPCTPATAQRLALAASAVNPLAVSTASAIAVEASFLQRARRRPQLRTHHALHAAACGLGAVCFAVEDMCPHWPVIHSVWHCLSAFSVASMNHLLADVEAERLGGGSSGSSL